MTGKVSRYCRGSTSSPDFLKYRNYKKIREKSNPKSKTYSRTKTQRHGEKTKFIFFTPL